MDCSNSATNVAGAIVAALDWNSSPDARKAAVSYLESVKSGDVRVLANTSFLLVKKDWSSEIRLHAFKLLQHLVRLRWDELIPAERRDFANVAVDLMSEVANTCEEWPLKSQSAALIAEIVRREGVTLWQELLPSLISLSNRGPVHAELISMTLRWLPEDITVHNEDLEGDRRRLLLRGLTQSLPEIFPLLYTLLERHFGAAMTEAGRQQLDAAKQHAATVTATLHAVNAYAEWAPLSDLSKFGIIHCCGFLLSSPDFRLHACEFFKLVSSRKVFEFKYFPVIPKLASTNFQLCQINGTPCFFSLNQEGKRPIDAASEFDSAVTNVFQILMNVSTDLLNRSAVAMNESEFEFAEYICESMVSLGTLNLQCIVGDSVALSLYFQQMLGYFKHYKLALHYQSLLFWLALMRDLLSKSKTVVLAAADSSDNNSNSGLGHADIQKRKLMPFVNDDICNVLLDVSFQRVLKKEKVHPGKALSAGELELWSDDFEGKGDFGQYRSRLLELIRFVASTKPIIAATKVSERIIMIIQSLLLSSAPAQELVVVESMQVALENIVGAIFDGPDDSSGSISETQLASCKIFEGLLQQLLTLKWTQPELVEVLGHYFDALGPFLKYHPDSVGSVISKLFELLTSLPFVVKDPSTSTSRHARLQICTAFIRMAKAADKSLLPHMKGIADRMSYLQKEGQLLRGEHNLLGEAFLIMASAAGSQQQQEVLAWLLEPLSKQWIQPEWQNTYLSDPTGLVKLCTETKFMWSLFHTVTFFEKALKRSGVRRGNPNLHNSVMGSTPTHPLASHLSWMLPPLLKLLRAVHSLWSSPVTLTLPGEIKAAMIMSDTERTSLLGEGNPKMPKGALTFADGSQFDLNKEGYTEPNEADIRNWLKGIRDSGYNVVGLSATVGDSFFKCLDIQSVAVALVENIQSMEFRHIRQLIHSVLIPLVKNCPSDFWESWLETIFHPLLLHSQQALSYSWSGLLETGRAKVPDRHGIMNGSDLKVEVIEEKLLRDLTREICSLLSVSASSGLNTGLPSADSSGIMNRGDMASVKDLEAFASSSMVGFLLKHKSLAIPALQISLDAFKWTDGESVSKISSFCGAVIVLATSTNNLELRQFVCKDLFSAIINGLALESNAMICADLVGLCREIFVYLSDRDPAPRQILLSLPCITPQELHAFEEALGKTSSPKEQKQLMKSFLVVATGNSLKALAAQKSVNVITNVSARPRNLVTAPESRTEEAGPIGLAAIM